MLLAGLLQKKRAKESGNAKQVVLSKRGVSHLRILGLASGGKGW